ncbi:GNAT family N-acetyltransferase [Rhodobacteraceae bacterium RKSG542]|nr:GNAT family N-acetyltransferase [Pseudovibrio flavus]
MSRIWSRQTHDDILVGEGVYLRPPVHADYAEWRELREESRSFLQPWEPKWTDTELSKSAFRYRLRRYSAERRAGTSFPYFLFNGLTHQLLGGINITHVRRGVSQAASMGYWMGQRYAGCGYMRRGTQRLLRHMFEHEKLHRVEAACLPSNEVSIGLLKRVGFHEIGYARDYLHINGRWQDHVLFACLSEDLRIIDTISPSIEVSGDKSPLKGEGDVKHAL